MSEQRQSYFQSISIASAALTRDAKNVGQLKCFETCKKKEGNRKSHFKFKFNNRITDMKEKTVCT